MFELLLSLFLIAVEICVIHSVPRVSIRRKEYFIFFFLQFFILAGFRGLEIHPDTPTYGWHFSEVSSEGPFWDVEKNVFNYGYLYIEKFIHNVISSSVLGFNLATSFLVCLCTLLLFYKKSAHMGMAIYLYYASGEFFNQIGVLRQSFAVLLGYYIICLISEKKYFYSFLLTLFAMSIHSSAVLLFLLLLFEKYSPGIKTKKYILIIVVGILYLIAPIIESITVLLEYESEYFTSHGADRGFATLNGFFNGSIGLMGCWATIKMMKNAEDRGYVQSDLNKNVLYIYLLISLLTLRLPIMSRFLMFLNPLLFVIISNLCFVSKKNYRFAIFALIVFASNIVLKQALRPGWIGIFPYYFYSDDQLNILAPPG